LQKRARSWSVCIICWRSCANRTAC